MSSFGRLRGVFPLVLVLALAGCKQPKATQAEVDEGPSKQEIIAGIKKQNPLLQRTLAGWDLRNIAQLYNFAALEGTPPKKVEDLKELDAPTVKAIKDGEVIVLWNAPKATPGGAVIAYEKNVPTQGGMVATFGGTVERMTPEEFKKAPKATGR